MSTTTEHGQEVVALVVPTRPEAPVTTEAVLAHLRERLSSYKLPSRTYSIDASEVPYLSSQKPDRRALATRCAELAQTPGSGR